MKHGGRQIAVFNFVSRGRWYASENRCPHKNAFALSRGVIGDAGGEPKVACQLHKRSFSLESGKCLGGEPYSVRVFPVKVEAGEVLVLLPAHNAVNDERHGERLCSAQCSSLQT